MTTAICFDLDGTLVTFDRPYTDIMAESFEAHLGETSDDLVAVADEAFYEAFGDQRPDPFHDLFAAAADHLGVAVDLDSVVADHREREYALTSVAAATRDSLDALAADEDILLGVITDGPEEWQLGKLAHHDLDGYFDATVASYAAGAHKPDGAPYDLARERLPADEYVMVGDSYEADVEAARENGFVPIHVERDEGGPDFWAALRAML